MVTQVSKTKRIRITRKEKEQAKQSIKKEREKAAKSKPIPSEPKKYGKETWHGGIYCDSYGKCCGLDSNLGTIPLGKIEDVLAAIEGKDIDTHDGEAVLAAIREFRSGKDFHSCHSKLKNRRPRISPRGKKSIVATLKKDPDFVRLLEHLISQNLGIRAIHSELKARRYEIPMRTLGRWVRQRRDTI